MGGIGADDGESDIFHFLAILPTIGRCGGVIRLGGRCCNAGVKQWFCDCWRAWSLNEALIR